EKPRLPNSETGAGTRGAGAGCSLGGLASEPLAKLAVVVSVVVAGARVLGTNFVFATGTPISVGTRPTTTRTNRVVDASKPAAGAQRHATRSAKSLATVLILPPAAKHTRRTGSGHPPENASSASGGVASSRCSK